MVRRFLFALLGVACAALCLHAQAVAPIAPVVPTTPLAAHDIPRGTELTPADIAGDTASRVGWVARRVIHEGEQLKEPAVVPPQLVRIGSEVTVRAEAGGVVVTRVGTALSGGALGDHIRVRLDAQHTITGIVASAATVKIQ
jgi:flagella basal body P-ring formation protein FlgA